MDYYIFWVQIFYHYVLFVYMILFEKIIHFLLGLLVTLILKLRLIIFIYINYKVNYYYTLKNIYFLFDFFVCLIFEISLNFIFESYHFRANLILQQFFLCRYPILNNSTPIVIILQVFVFFLILGNNLNIILCNLHLKILINLNIINQKSSDSHFIELDTIFSKQWIYLKLQLITIG